ncbi:MAG: outer membrane receptor protein involved in Fe transport [Oceanicoccus sp.]|jgi:outer membrane receptor protein involved in Fe transport
MSSSNKFQQKTLAISIATATLLAGQVAFISSASAALEEVMVTATARSQSTQDIPFNISAIQGSDIAEQAIVDSTELMRTIPGVTLNDRGHRNSGLANSLVIRGINVNGGISGDVAQQTVAPVSTYVDNTPIFANFLLKDMERVEVLRGPQGTLYGSGSLGGTVRYIMNKPTMDAVSGSVNAGYGQSDGSDGDNKNIDMVLNLPISDRLAFRVSAGKMDNDGIIDFKNLYQLADGIPVVKTDSGDCVSVNDSSLSDSEIINNGSCYTSKDDADTVEIEYARASLRFEPTDDLSIQVNYQRQEDEVGARRAVTNGGDYNWTNDLPGGIKYGEYDNGSTMLEPSEREVELTTLDVEVDLGFATLTSNTSYYDHSGNGVRDNTSIWVTDRGGFANWFDILYTGNPRPVAFVEAGYDEEAVVQEFRLVSNGDAKVDWLAGLYYMDQDRSSTNFSHLLGLKEYGAVTPADEWWDGATDDKDVSLERKENFTDLAVYGEVTYNVSDELRVTAGMRWFDNELTNDSAFYPEFDQPDYVPFKEYASQQEDDTQFKLNVSWDVTDRAMLYATYSEGFRRGGSNVIIDAGFFEEGNIDSVQTYGKDTVKNYEIGIKGSTERLRYAADIYFIDWQDPQIDTATADWGFFMAQNGESAQTQGVELELEALITENLIVTTGYSYTKAELTDDLIQPQYGAVLSEDGQRLPGTPEHVATLGLNHTMDINTDMTLVTRLSGYYQSDSLNNVDDSSTQQETHDSFSIWSVTSTLRMDSWSVSLYAKNMFNEKGVTGSYPEAYQSTDTGTFENYYGNNQRDYITTPRTIGVNVGYEF